MRRATVTLPDDLERELEEFLRAQEAPPSLAALLQAALRRYLADRRPAAGEVREPREPFDAPPAAIEGGGSGGGEPAGPGAASHPGASERELRRRAIAATGGFASGRGDVARRHDEELARAFRS